MIRAILLVLALGSAGMAGWIYMQQGAGQAPVAADPSSTQPTPAEPPPPPVEMVGVLGAVIPLEPGQTVRAVDFTWIDWPADRLLSHQMIRSEMPDAPERLDGRVAMIAAAAGEPVRADGFAAPAARPISQRLAPGMRAVAVRVNLEAAVGGFVLPNDRVDVIHTDTGPGGGPARSTIVVFNARVIAIDQITEQGTDETILVSRTATLELDRAGAEAVASAQQTGQLTLALRSSADTDEPSSVPPTLAQTLAPGMRAVVLQEVELATGGSILPGDRIDVIHSFVPAPPAAAINTVIVSNVRVIAIDRFASTDARGVARTVTLELDQAGVEALSAARELGSLSLSLRSAADLNEPPQVHFPTVPAPAIEQPEVRVRRGGDL